MPIYGAQFFNIVPPTKELISSPTVKKLTGGTNLLSEALVAPIIEVPTETSTLPEKVKQVHVIQTPRSKNDPRSLVREKPDNVYKGWENEQLTAHFKLGDFFKIGGSNPASVGGKKGQVYKKTKDLWIPFTFSGISARTLAKELADMLEAVHLALSGTPSGSLKLQINSGFAPDEYNRETRSTYSDHGIFCAVDFHPLTNSKAKRSAILKYVRDKYRFPSGNGKSRYLHNYDSFVHVSNSRERTRGIKNTKTPLKSISKNDGLVLFESKVAWFKPKDNYDEVQNAETL